MQQESINDDHLGQVDESWYLMKQQVFIWDQMHFNKMFYWLTQLVETMQYQRKHVTA